VTNLSPVLGHTEQLGKKFRAIQDVSWLVLAAREKYGRVCTREIIKVSDQAIVDRCLEVIGRKDKKVCIDTKSLGKVPEFLCIRSCTRTQYHLQMHVSNTSNNSEMTLDDGWDLSARHRHNWRYAIFGSSCFGIQGVLCIVNIPVKVLLACVPPHPHHTQSSKSHRAHTQKEKRPGYGSAAATTKKHQPLCSRQQQATT
jgi:hypothetical protein